jgi:hypothetical protein
LTSPPPRKFKLIVEELLAGRARVTVEGGALERADHRPGSARRSSTVFKPDPGHRSAIRRRRA